MEQPSKEEVEAEIEKSRGYNFVLNPPAAIYRKKYIVIAKAYLALREEVDSKDKTNLMLAREVGSLELENRQLKAENEALRAEVVKWQRIRTPTHGTCCTCQRCGQFHDDCRCDLDEVCDELDQLKAQNQALRARLGNNILEA